MNRAQACFSMFKSLFGRVVEDVERALEGGKSSGGCSFEVGLRSRQKKLARRLASFAEAPVTSRII